MKGLTPSCPLGQSSQLSPEPVSPGLPLVSQFQFYSYSLHFLPRDTGRASLAPAMSGVSFNTASNHHLLFTGCLFLMASLVISGFLCLSHTHTQRWKKGFSPSQFLPHPTALPKTDPNQLESRKQEIRMYRAGGTNRSSELQEQSHHSKLRTREYLEGK